MGTERFELLRRKLNTMLRYLDGLEDKLPTERVAYLSGVEILHWGIERGCQLSIECTIDANNLLVTTTGGSPPDTARDSFRLIFELGAIDQAICSAFQFKFVPFRNRIVHVYEDLDNSIVYESAQSLLDWGRRYVQQINSYLDEQEQNINS